MIKEITIKAVLNGFVVTVGCQTVVFNETKTLLSELEGYLEKPEETEKFYLENAINSRHIPQLPTNPYPTAERAEQSTNPFLVRPEPSTNR